MRFVKMHGYGNAYIFVDCRRELVNDPACLARLVSDPHTGIGSDGLFLIFPSEVADVRAEMYNADGSRMSMCGNGVRCTGKLVLEGDWNAGCVLHTSQPVDALQEKLAADGQDDCPTRLAAIMSRAVRTLGESGAGELAIRELAIHELTIETDAGVKTLFCYLSGGRVVLVTTDMGQASLNLTDMDCTLAGETAINRKMTVAGREYRLTCVSTGNLHGVVFVPDTETVDLETEGRALECCSIFPDRANIHFVQRLSDSHLRMRIWERGSGATRACGTGACAAVVAAMATGLAGRSCAVDQPGGRQLVDVGDSVFLTGEAHTVCAGQWFTPELA